MITITKKDRALMVAELVHKGQTYDIYPYAYHVKRVAEIAEILGFDEEIVIGCILHDVLEDTHLSFNDIKKAFGKNIAEIVFCVTDELGRNRTEKHAKTYPKIRGNWKATAVKICDRIANTIQSKEYNKDKFLMYKNEYAEFRNAIQCTEHPIDVLKAWEYLERIMEAE